MSEQAVAAGLAGLDLTGAASALAAESASTAAVSAEAAPAQPEESDVDVRALFLEAHEPSITTIDHDLKLRLRFGDTKRSHDCVRGSWS